MIDSYWDLYVAYVDKCVRDNWINDIDPHHYEMEWNHWLPKAVFPDIPLGQWLTLRQHAIASALQTLALGENCLCPWHVSYLPASLWSKVRPLFVQNKRELGLKQVKNQTGIHAPGMQSLAGQASAEKCKERGEGVYDSRTAREWGKRGGSKTLLMRVGIHAPGSHEKHREAKIEGGRKGGKKGGPKSVALKLGAHGRSKEKMSEDGKKAAYTLWKSTMDGFIGNAGNVAQHNKANGWDPDARVRL
jgi:general stress protein YciG